MDDPLREQKGKNETFAFNRVLILIVMDDPLRVRGSESEKEFDSES